MVRGNKELMKSAYERWCNSNYNSIYKAYSKPSSNKISAWTDCVNLCKNLNGSDLKVIGRNCYKFTAGFVGYVGDKNVFVFITDRHDRYIELEEVK